MGFSDLLPPDAVGFAGPSMLEAVNEPKRFVAGPGADHHDVEPVGGDAVINATCCVVSFRTCLQSLWDDRGGLPSPAGSAVRRVSGASGKNGSEKDLEPSTWEAVTDPAADGLHRSVALILLHRPVL
jgi:hypothetical protein